MLVLCLLLCRFFFFSYLLLNVSSPRRTSTHTYIHTKLAKLIVHLNHCPCLFSFTRTGPVRVRSKSRKAAPSVLCLLSIVFSPFFFFCFGIYCFFFPFFPFLFLFFFLRYFFSLPSDLPTQRSFFFFLFRNAYASSAFFFFCFASVVSLKSLKRLTRAYFIVNTTNRNARTLLFLSFFFFWLF